jgi:hypothetical protein
MRGVFAHHRINNLRPAHVTFPLDQGSQMGWASAGPKCKNNNKNNNSLKGLLRDEFSSNFPFFFLM